MVWTQMSINFLKITAVLTKSSWKVVKTGYYIYLTDEKNSHAMLNLP